MKIAIYAVAYNQHAFVKAWLENCVEADLRVVADLGGNGGPLNALQDLPLELVSMAPEARSLNFQRVRNKCLEVIPGDFDVCISLDLHERLSKGWRQEIEKIEINGPTALYCPLTASWTKNGDLPLEAGFAARIHTRKGFAWKFAVGETLESASQHQKIVTDRIEIQKEKGQGAHPAMGLVHFESLMDQNPNETHYLLQYARYLFNEGQFEKAMEASNSYLQLQRLTSKSAERSFVYRLLARCHKMLNKDPEISSALFFKSAAEAPWERESWTFFALEMAKAGNWPACFASSLNALKITSAVNNYVIEPPAWAGLPEHLLKLSKAHLGR